MMLLAFSTAAIGSLGTAVFGPAELRARASWLFFWMLLIACMTDVLAALSLPGLFVLLILGIRNGSLEKGNLVARSLRIAPLFALVFAYYALMLASPGALTEVLDDARHGPSMTFSMVSLYEQVGFAGIGPPRNAVRPMPTLSAAIPYAALLAAALVAYLVALALSLRRRPDASTMAFLGAWGASLAFAAIASTIVEVRFLGRHMAAVLPFMLFGAVGLFRSRLALMLVAVVFCVSDLRLSLLPEYGKDDYRAAVHDVVDRSKAAGGQIDWAADEMTANYYHLALRPQPKRAVSDAFAWPANATGTLVEGWGVDSVEALVARQLQSGPIYVAISKPDMFDKRGAWRQILQRPYARLAARYESFEVYELRTRGGL